MMIFREKKEMSHRYINMVKDIYAGIVIYVRSFFHHHVFASRIEFKLFLSPYARQKLLFIKNINGKIL